MEESSGEQVLKLEDGWDLLTGTVRAERADAQGWTPWGNPQTEREGRLPSHVIRGRNKRKRSRPQLTGPHRTSILSVTRCDQVFLLLAERDVFRLTF